MYCFVTRHEIQTEDQNNLSETGLCRVSDEIIRDRGWDFLSTTILLFTHFCDEFCQFLVQNKICCVSSNRKNKFTNEFSRCKKFLPQNGSEITFQASVT